MFDNPPGSTSAPVASGISELFQSLRDGRPRTRAELALTTGLARSTIAARVDALMALGLVVPVGDARSTGGRPSSRFAFNPNARVVLAADLGASHATVAVSDLAGVVLGEHTEPLDIASGPDAVLGWFMRVATELLTSLERTAADVAAVGIGVPGPVEHTSGRPVNPPIMPGWDQFDVPGRVHEYFDVPVLVDNDVNIMAIGERAFAWPDTDDLIFVKVATGIGSGIISGGALQRGAQGIAGDMGHVPVVRGAGIACHCGNRGCIEALASGPAIAAELRRQGIDAETSRDVVRLVGQGNVQAIQAVRQAGRDIGEVLSVAVSFINPSVIAIGGSLARVGEHLVAGVREIVYARSTPLAAKHLAIVASEVGNAAILGASMLAIEHVLSPAGVDALSESAAARS